MHPRGPATSSLGLASGYGRRQIERPDDGKFPRPTRMTCVGQILAFGTGKRRPKRAPSVRIGVALIVRSGEFYDTDTAYVCSSPPMVAIQTFPGIFAPNNATKHSKCSKMLCTVDLIFPCSDRKLRSCQQTCIEEAS